MWRCRLSASAMHIYMYDRVGGRASGGHSWSVAGRQRGRCKVPRRHYGHAYTYGIAADTYMYERVGSRASSRLTTGLCGSSPALPLAVRVARRSAAVSPRPYMCTHIYVCAAHVYMYTCQGRSRRPVSCQPKQGTPAEGQCVWRGRVRRCRLSHNIHTHMRSIRMYVCASRGWGGLLDNRWPERGSHA